MKSFQRVFLNRISRNILCSSVMIFLIFFHVKFVNALPRPIDVLEMPSQNRDEVYSQLSGKLIWNDYLKIVQDEHQSMKIRWRAMMALVRIDKKKAEKEIPRFIDNKTWYIRNAALVALNEIDRYLSAKYAEKLISDPALVVRSAAVEILKNNLNQQRRDLLWDEFHQARNIKGQGDLWIRSQILEILAKNPRPHEKKIFETITAQKNTELAKIAQSVLQNQHKMK